MTTAQQVSEAIDKFFALLEGPVEDDLEMGLLLLADVLDELMMLGRHPHYFFEGDHPDPPGNGLESYHRFRDVATRRFPDLHFYNLATPVSEKPGEAELVVGDPYDDLADIAGDFSDIRWCFADTSPNDALWRFYFGYQSHWGDHASNLRWYLFARQWGH